MTPEMLAGIIKATKDFIHCDDCYATMVYRLAQKFGYRIVDMWEPRFEEWKEEENEVQEG